MIKNRDFYLNKVRKESAGTKLLCCRTKQGLIF
jgi:hypothetical protein